MEVTRDTLEAMLPAIKAAVKQASFVAFDLEFTGLGAPSATRQTFLDTAQTRFEGAFESTGSFFPLQVCARVCGSCGR